MNNITEHKKICPDCNKLQYYSRKDSLELAKRTNAICLSCSQKGKLLSSETKNRIRISLVGRKVPLATRNKISCSMVGKVGKPHTKETKHKLRLATILDLKKKGVNPSNSNFNPAACKFIDMLNEEHGWNLQHARNGGEIELYGYFVDGYDKDRNIIFEYDELSHERRDRKRKDLIRQNNLLEKINPTKFIRYNEKNNRLYEIKRYENN